MPYMDSIDETLLVRLRKAREDAYAHADMIAEIIKVFEDPKVRRTLAMHQTKLLPATKPHSRIGQIAESYFAVLKNAGVGSQTINNYKSQLRPFFDRKAGIKLDDIFKILSDCGKGKSEKSRTTQESITRNFFQWAAENGLIAQNPFEKKQQPRMRKFKGKTS